MPCNRLMPVLGDPVRRFRLGARRHRTYRSGRVAVEQNCSALSEEWCAIGRELRAAQATGIWAVLHIVRRRSGLF
jgi:hypothetical protein